MYVITTQKSIKTKMEEKMKKDNNENEQQLLSCKEEVFFEPGIDYIFKKVFGSEVNKDVLKGLICSILDIPHGEVKEITIMNGELAKQNRKDKLSRLDILLKLNNEKVINLEMQMFNYKTLPRRILYYWSQVYVSTSESGQDYDELKPCITIWLLNQTMFKETEKAHTVFTIREKELNIQFSDVFEAHIIELSKTDENNDKLNEWIKFFKLKSKEEMEMLRENTTDIDVKKAIDIVKLMTLDEKSRYEYINRVMEIKDYYTLKNEAIKEGKEEGRLEGIREGIREGKEVGKKEEKREIAKKLLNAGVDLEIIKSTTGLKEDELQKLKEEEK